MNHLIKIDFDWNEFAIKQFLVWATFRRLKASEEAENDVLRLASELSELFNLDHIVIQLPGRRLTTNEAG